MTFSHAIKALNIGKSISSRRIWVHSVWDMPFMLWLCVLPQCLFYLRIGVKHTLVMTLCIVRWLCSMLRCVMSSVHVSMSRLRPLSLSLTFLCQWRLSLIRLSLIIWYMRPLSFESLSLKGFRSRRSRITRSFNKVNVRW